MQTLRSHLISVLCLTLMAAVALAVPAFSQSVIGARSGVIYYFDGAVYVNDQALESHLGKFPSVPEGAVLRTAQGRAEVLLTPGVFLRMGENSAIRMLSSDLANTRVELQSGSAIVDSSEPSSGTAVTLVFRGWEIHSREAGTYRVDSDPARLWVLKGDAEVATNTGGQPVPVNEGMDLPLGARLRPEQSTAEPTDTLSDWAKGRRDSIVADNSITEQIDADPATQMSLGFDGVSGFSYFPFLGVPVLGMRMGLYSSPYGGAVVPVQPGFYSMYLPGYTYAPQVLLLPSHLGRIAPPPFRGVPGALPRPYPGAPAHPVIVPGTHTVTPTHAIPHPHR